jgi:hypothetical protein
MARLIESSTVPIAGRDVDPPQFQIHQPQARN